MYYSALLLVIHLAKQTQNLSKRAKPYVAIAFIFLILESLTSQ